MTYLTCYWRHFLLVIIKTWHSLDDEWDKYFIVYHRSHWLPLFFVSVINVTFLQSKFTSLINCFCVCERVSCSHCSHMSCGSHRQNKMAPTVTHQQRVRVIHWPEYSKFEAHKLYDFSRRSSDTWRLLSMMNCALFLSDCWYLSRMVESLATERKRSVACIGVSLKYNCALRENCTSSLPIDGDCNWIDR